MTDESDTYLQLKAGHLISRQQEVSHLINAELSKHSIDIDFTRVRELSDEALSISKQLSKIYMDEAEILDAEIAAKKLDDSSK